MLPLNSCKLRSKDAVGRSVLTYVFTSSPTHLLNYSLTHLLTYWLTDHLHVVIVGVAEGRHACEELVG